MRNPVAESQPAVAAMALLGQGAPKSVGVIHYGPDGARVATTGQASYSAGSGGGATVQYTSKLAGGAPYGSSQITVDGQGRAVSAASQLLNPDGSVRKQVSADYSGLVLNAAGQPSSGAVTFAVADPDGTPTDSAQMTYAGERFDSYMVQQFGSGGSQTVAGRTEIGFGNAQLAGNRLTGGVLDLSYYKAGTTLATRSRSVLTARGLPSELLSTNYATDGQTPSLLVHSDYSGIAFDPRGKIDHGKLLVTTQTPAGDVLTTSLFSYANGKLISALKCAPGAVVPRIVVAPSKPVPGPWNPTRPPDRTNQITRPDGTLIERREDWYATGAATPPRPLRTLITGFATDGSTVVRVTDIDYSGAGFDASGLPLSGSIVSTLFEAGVRSSTTQITY
jgi:hypothetical protein